MYYPLPVYTCYMYCSQFDSYLLPINVYTLLHVLFSIYYSYLTTHYLYTRVTCITHSIWLILLPITCDSYVLLIVIWLRCSTHSNLLPYYYCIHVLHVLYSYQFDSYVLPITCIHMCTTHCSQFDSYVLPIPYDSYYMYCSQFNSYLLPIPAYTWLTCITSQFDSYLLPITCIHVLHVLFSIWLIFTTHYLYTRNLHVLFSIWLIFTTHYLYTHMLHVLLSIWLIFTTHYLHTFTCIVLNLTHMYYPLPVYICYMYCSQFDSYVLITCTTHVTSIWLILLPMLYTRVTCIALNLTHIYYPLPVYTFYMYCSQFDS